MPRQHVRTRERDGLGFNEVTSWLRDTEMRDPRIKIEQPMSEMKNNAELHPIQQISTLYGMGQLL